MRWAFLNIPLRRRLETATLLLWVCMLPICALICFACLAFPILWPFTIIYLIYMLLDKAARSGGRPLKVIRNMRLWTYFAGYFPLKLVKEVDLDPKESYLLAYHPHGIIGFGAWGNFCSNATGFDHLFPKINLRVCTLDNNFVVPVFRDLLLSIGMISASKESISSVLKRGPGNAVMIVVGGAAEALDARPGTSDLTIKNRKGFVKMALKHGANLVPVFSFGENDAYNVLIANPQGSRIRTLQNKLKSVFGFSMPLFIGRGVFNYDFGLLPMRSPITSVVGKPIKVPKLDVVDNETLDKYHDIYIKELQALYDRHKDTYAPNRKKDIRIM